MPNPLHSTASGLDLHEDKRIKIPVRAASTANVTLATPGASMDGVTLSSGDRVLLKNQTTTSQNGPYVWTGASSLLTRTSDADAAADFVYGFLVYCREGTANANTYWQFSQTAAITLETTALTFTSLASGAVGVTSVAMSVPGEFGISGSPVTSSGTLALSKSSVSPNSVAAGPASGSAAAWAFRGLAAADLPVMGASGASHAAGAVPDPGASAGGTRFLNENATFTVPAGTGGGGSGSGGSGSGALVPIMIVGPLTVAQAAISFASIPQTGFRNLRIEMVIACNGTGTSQALGMQFNSDTAANYGYTTTASTTGTPATTRATGLTSAVVGFVPATTALASSADALVIEIPSYTSTTFKKAYRARGGGVLTAAVTGIELDSTAGQWESTAAITSIVLTPANGSVIAGSYACLYGEMDTAGMLLTPASNLLYETLLLADAAAIDTGTISQAYRNLEIEFSLRTTAGSQTIINLTYNGDSTAGNYSASGGRITIASSAAQTAGRFTAGWILIPDYTSPTTTVKSATGITTRPDAAIENDQHYWTAASAQAITRLTFTPASGNFLAGSSIRVCGTPASAGGAAVGTGTELHIASNQSISNGTVTPIGWTSESSDADNQHYTSSANLTGTVAKTATSQTLTGTTTAFLTELSVGQVISVPGGGVEKRVVIAIASNTSLTVSTPFTFTSSGQTATRLNAPIVFRQPGWYGLQAGISWANNATGYREVGFYLNDAATPFALDSRASIGNLFMAQTVAGSRNFQQWDFVEVGVQQTSGGALNAINDATTFFSVNARPTVIIAVPYVNLQDVKSAGSDGGTFTSGAWQTRTLNTVVSDSAGLTTLASNQFTLPPGTYRIHALAPAHAADRHQTRIRNITAGITALVGTLAFGGASTSVMSNSFVTGRFTLSVVSTMELQHRCQTTRATDGFGTGAGASGFGESTVYAVLEVWKEG